MSEQQIRMYGADWCGDCRRTKAQLDGLGVAYEYLDVEANPELAEEARGISGRTTSRWWSGPTAATPSSRATPTPRRSCASSA
ncbi:glutaredoxin family protein [Parenemella sanctibonifatiensis]|uniref:glutaredoxin family protein n=1 Tax=Parenemella sanctibonifatiensis TaxID=2016505 RepID=UPI001E38268C|nr:glutaredoxin family protein [Parenemella sanctibonifatiensis]